MICKEKRDLFAKLTSLVAEKSKMTKNCWKTKHLISPHELLSAWSHSLCLQTLQNSITITDIVPDALTTKGPTRGQHKGTKFSLCSLISAQESWAASKLSTVLTVGLCGSCFSSCSRGILGFSTSGLRTFMM